MKTTSHYKIFDYWKDMAILRSGKVVRVDDEELGVDAEAVIDGWWIPCCWACGYRAMNDKELQLFDEKNKDLPEVDYYKKLYGLKAVKSRLNMCHIRPKALGGNNEPENMFLLCEECHHFSPDTTNRDAFFRWVYDRKAKFWDGKLSPYEVLRLFDEELCRRGLPTMRECIEATNGKYEVSDPSSYLMANVNSHCSKVQDTSLIVGFVDWFLNDIQQHVSIDELYRIASEKIRLNTSEHNGYFVIK